MKTIRTPELQALPAGSLFFVYDGRGDREEGLYVWHGCVADSQNINENQFPDWEEERPNMDKKYNPLFGYAFQVVPEDDGYAWDNTPSRFYFRPDYDAANGKETFYLLEKKEVKLLASVAEKALTL